MGTGTVDVNWAKQHHSLWLDQQQAGGRASPPAEGRVQPAE
jgi:formate dehydrogenase subunit gamma